MEQTQTKKKKSKCYITEIKYNKSDKPAKINENVDVRYFIDADGIEKLIVTEYEEQ